VVGADRRLLFELVLGTLRWLRRLDWVISSAAGRPLRKIDKGLRAPLRIAVYQLLFLDRVSSYAVVDEAVKEVRRREQSRATGFVNAVLRRVGERRSLAEWPVEADSLVKRLGIETSHPDFLVKRWLDRFETSVVEGLLAANNRAKPMHLLCMGDREEIVAALRDSGVDTRQSALSPGGLRVLDGDPLATDLFREGKIYVQDDASQAAALVPPPRPGDLILDAAASPGGKGFALEASESTVSLVSADLSLDRMQALRDNHRRLNLAARVVAADASRTPFAQVFDRVVLDLPCSGTGTIARHPELKWRLTEDEIVRLASRGRAMLGASAGLVRVGGLVCIVTCSLEVEENEYVVRQFLKRHRDFELVDLEGLLSESIARGIEAPGRWRVLTTPEHDGFTVHVLRRTVGG
jgi:16S rRNA (cytosine967-C5)-methyltransferase